MKRSKFIGFCGSMCDGDHRPDMGSAVDNSHETEHDASCTNAGDTGCQARGDSGAHSDDDFARRNEIALRSAWW